MFYVQNMVCAHDANDAIKHAVFENFSAALVMWFYDFFYVSLQAIFVFFMFLCCPYGVIDDKNVIRFI